MLSGGGFSYETAQLLQPLSKNFSFVYLVTEYGGQPGLGGIPTGDPYSVPSFPNVTNPSKLHAIKAFWGTFLQARRVIRQTCPDLTIVVGCSHAVPVFLAARTCGVRSVFVESITRTDQLSITGRLVKALHLADLFIVQWPELQRYCTSAQLGSIL